MLTAAGASTYTLFKCSFVQVSNAIIGLNVYIWHLNATQNSYNLLLSGQADIEILIPNLQFSIGASNGTGGPELAKLGMCLAKTQLAGSYTNVVTNAAPIGPNETVIQPIAIPAGCVAAGIFLLELVNPIPGSVAPLQNVTFRTSVSPTKTLMGSMADDPEAANSQPRGLWLSNTVLCEMGPIELNS